MTVGVLEVGRRIKRSTVKTTITALTTQHNYLSLARSNHPLSSFSPFFRHLSVVFVIYLVVDVLIPPQIIYHKVKISALTCIKQCLFIISERSFKPFKCL